jgi:hypothetical protein
MDEECGVHAVEKNTKILDGKQEDNIKSKTAGRMWTGFNWFRMRTCGRLL